ncbi:MAG: site-specific integrase [Gallionella sp.]|nr:site-specific integrase [Gallionella sp.]
MATIRVRGDGQFQAQIRNKGFAPISRTFKTRRLAEQWVTVTESEMIRGEFIPRKAVEVITLEKCLTKYAEERSAGKKGEKQELVRINKLKLHPLAKKAVSQITVDDIEDYIYERRKDKSQRNPENTVSEATIRLEVMLLSAVFEAAKSKRWNYCRTNPVRDIDQDARPGKSSERVRRLVGDEESRLLAALDKRCRNADIPLVVRLAIATAARQSEIIGKDSTSTRPASPGLCWENVNLAQRSAKLIDTKNGKDRIIPIGDSALSLLSALPRPITGGRVFKVTQDGLIRSFAAACVDAKIEDLTFHDLRHEATSRMVEAGLSLLEVQSITGHSNAEMVKRYTHLDTLKLAKKLG